MLVIVFVLLTAALGYFFGYLTWLGFWGLGIEVAFSFFMSWWSYFASDKIALAVSRAKAADETRYAQLHNFV